MTKHNATTPNQSTTLNWLYVDEGNPAQEITFHTQSGPLAVARSAVDNSMVTNDSTRIALSMTLPYIYPNDALPSSCSSAESPVVKALSQGLKVRSPHIHAEAHFVKELVCCSVPSPHADAVIDVPLNTMITTVSLTDREILNFWV